VNIPTTLNLMQALEDTGYPLPKECREVRLVMGVDSPFILQFDVMLTAEDLARIGAALQKIGAAE
jgi:hypothetical protein